MFADVVELRAFYSTPLGRMAARRLSRAIEAIWPDARGQVVAGLGYCVPWLHPLRDGADRVLALMPAAQGAVEWPHEGPIATVLVAGEQLPLADASVDRLLIVHMLEHSVDPAETLSEAWRVLSPGGKMLLAAPNRRGLWARFEHTPFGTGRPFSKGQLSTLLRDSLLTPTQWADVLNFPPVTRPANLRFAQGIDRIGHRLWPVFAGVILVEATKRLYQGLPARKRAGARVFVPALAPQPNASALDPAGHATPRRTHQRVMDTGFL